MSDQLVHIGETLVSGIVFDPKNSETLRTMDVQDLLNSVSRLFGLLDDRGVDYLLAGGIAMLVYVEGRNTQGIDLILSAADLERLPEIEVVDRNPEFARGAMGDLQVDLLFAQNALFDKVRCDYAAITQFAEREVRCATVEGLLLLKLFALPSLYRQAQLDRVRMYEGDIASLLARYQPDVEAILAELSQHLTENDLREIRNIVSDIQRRIEEAGKRFNSDQYPTAAPSLRGSVAPWRTPLAGSMRMPW